ncbi:hypothetical protein DERP_009574 [Dermatophagoides pteronyssinus]|uniref:Uncharacterized protein n=1 Tax=Dermatophagoides pteronyssinus TaxID=6956 RepID=A0ABQ8JAV1_DERPT|nr:hypothetical protein DERP_009574 [Dermatophagoides pteronyssinus]
MHTQTHGHWVNNLFTENGHVTTFVDLYCSYPDDYSSVVDLYGVHHFYYMVALKSDKKTTTNVFNDGEIKM